MNGKQQDPRTDDKILKDMNPVAKQVLLNSGYTPQQIAERIRNAETPGHKDYGNYFDMTDNNIRGAHRAFTQAGIKYKEGKSAGDEFLNRAGALGKKGDLIDNQIIAYSNWFPVNVNNKNPFASENAHKETFKLMQQSYSTSDPSNPTKGGPNRSPYWIRKKPIVVGIVVPRKMWKLGIDKAKLKQQIDLAGDYLESIGIEAGLDHKIVYSDDPRLGGKVHLMPLNKKNQPMFSHWDKGVNWKSGLSIAGGSALVGGGGAVGKVLAPSVTTGVLAKTVPKSLAALLIGAAAYGGGALGNKMINHDVLGMARDFQLPHALDIGYQELLKDKPSINFQPRPRGDSYDMLNDPFRVIQNRKAIGEYYYEKVFPGHSIGFETSALGYGSKPRLSKGTWDTIFDLMEQSNELYRKRGGTDPLIIQQKVEKEIELEQQKIKAETINKETQRPNQSNQPKTKKQEPESELIQWVNEQLSYGGY